MFQIFEKQGEGGAAAHQFHKFLKFYRENAQANDSGKHYKRLSRPGLCATFSDVCLVKTELRSKLKT